ncbi:hypothetical protein [Streptomyces sp. NPDC051636]|uniref:hypothetical protein n=1 Tax=Streptomyces sp. NPDC051636 TaxID=3365663 RepID=UPI0037AA170C
MGALVQGRLAAEPAAGETYGAALVAAPHTTAVLPLTVLAVGAVPVLLLRRRRPLRKLPSRTWYGLSGGSPDSTDHRPHAVECHSE